MLASRLFSKSVALAAILSSLALGRASALTLLDTFNAPAGTTESYTFTGSTPRTYMGDGFTNNSLPAGTTSFQITSFSFLVVTAAATTYTDVVGRIQFWNTANGGTTSATNPAFANAAGQLITVDLGALTSTANSIYKFDVTLNTPITLTGGSGTNWGFAQNFQGNTGAGLADDTNLTSVISYNTTSTGYAAGTITTGASPTFGYYRNANSETNFNFTSTSRSLGFNYQGVAIIINGNAVVPEPSSVALASFGGLGMLFALRRMRRRSA